MDTKKGKKGKGKHSKQQAQGNEHPAEDKTKNEGKKEQKK